MSCPKTNMWFDQPVNIKKIVQVFVDDKVIWLNANKTLQQQI